jgi:hypothetical protein
MWNRVAELRAFHAPGLKFLHVAPRAMVEFAANTIRNQPLA